MDGASVADSMMVDMVTRAPKIAYPPIRFGAETFFIGVSILVNIVGIIVVNRAQKTKASVYHIFYFNLAISNILACPLTWLCNNLLFIFNRWFSDMLFDPLSRCTANVYSLSGVFIALSVGIQMTLGMVGLGMVQYFAICQPLKSLYILQKKRTYTFIVCSLMFSLICAGLPILVMAMITENNPCSDDLLDGIFSAVIVIADVYIGVIGCLYIAMAVMAVRVYSAIKEYTKRQEMYNADKDKLEQDKRAFQTTIFLLLSLTLFFIPITIYFLVNLNVGGIEGVLENVIIFYITMMPCTKCIADPIIYGARMSDVAKEWRRVFCCDDDGNDKMPKTCLSTSLSDASSVQQISSYNDGEGNRLNPASLTKV